MNDSEIIALFFERSEQAIAELDKSHGALVRRILSNILDDPQDTEECVNDTYMELWKTIPPGRPDDLGAFACGTARHIGISRYRANSAKKRNSYYDTALDELDGILRSPANVEAEFDAKELSSYINSFLGTLPYDDLYILVRRFWYSDTVSGIAASMSLSPHAVSVRLFRLRGKLKKYLKKEGLIS